MTEVGSATVKVYADTSGVKAEIAKAFDVAKGSGLKAQVKSLEDVLVAFAKGRTAMGENAGAVAQYDREIEKAAGELVIARHELDQFTQAEAKATAQTKTLSGEVSKARTQTSGFDGVLSRLGGSSGRTGNALGLLAGKAGLIGFAASAAFQGIREIQESLRVTGDEAFTMEGKFRNAGAELLSGNLIGGIKALAAEQDRLSFKELIADGQASTTTLRLYGAETARAASEASKLADAQERQADANDKAGFTVNRYAGYARAAAVESAKFATELNNDAAAATSFANALDAAASYGDSLAESMNALAAIPDPFDNPVFRNQRERKPIGPTTKSEIALTIARATGDLNEVLALQITARDRLRTQLENTRLNGAKLAALAKEEAQAEAAVITTQKQIATAAAAAEKSIQDEKDKAAAERDKKAKADLAARKAARERLRLEYRADLDFQLGQIRNAESAAALTERTSDDIKQKRREIAHLKAREHDKRLTREERQAAQADKIAAQRDLRDLLDPKKATTAGGRGLTAFDILSVQRSIVSGYANNIALSGMIPAAARGAMVQGAPSTRGVSGAFDPWAQTNQSPPERNVTPGENAIVRAIEDLGELLKKATRPNVHVEQRFNDPTHGTHRELRYAKVAAEALADA